MAELERLSKLMPSAKDALVTQLVATVQTSGEGRLVIDGVVKSPGHVEVMESNLRDETHRVSGKGASQDPARSDYQWKFSESLTIQPPEPAPPNTTQPPNQEPVASPSDTNDSTTEVNDNAPGTSSDEPATDGTTTGNTEAQP
jgi:hypothetical protein